MSGESKFSLESILEEERRARAAEAAPKAEPVKEEPVQAAPAQEVPAAEPATIVLPEIPKAQMPELHTETLAEEPQAVQPEPQPEPQEEALPAEPAFEPKWGAEAVAEDGTTLHYMIPPMPEKKKKKEKKEKEKKMGFFARRREKKRQEAALEAEEDMYYGIQLKPIDEYTRSFDATGEISLEQEGFKKLFDENSAELDDEVAKDFERLQKERRRRVAEAVENAGVDVDAVENELGIVAPIPVSAFAGDPYAKQHGIEAETADANLPDFQKVMIQDAQTRTMELTLDPESDRVGLQQAKVMPEVSEDSVRRILETVQEEEPAAPEQAPVFTDVSSFSEEKMAEMDAARSAMPQVVDFAGEQPAEEDPQEAEETQPAQDAAPEAEQAEPETEPEPVKISLPVNDVTEYRKRDLPVHIINADVLQSALLSEARVYSEENAGRFKVNRKDPEPEAAKESVQTYENEELLDDYTSPADAKSISHDLRGTMRELTVRLLGTGVSTFVLVLAALICEAGFGPGNTALGGAIGYAVVTLIFLLVAIGFCAKTIRGGIRSLLDLRANSDSAAAVAAVAVLIQTVCAFLYTDALAAGQIHLYAGVAAGILFLNTLGKLVMVRRIHSNFRFVASRENKYAVRILDDYNASLKLTESAVVSRPALAYQQKADFLKRFLQISYEPDPAETASQALAPFGLVASLLLCVISLIVTKDPALSVTALAAACCVSTAVMNMLAVNLPVSRLSQRLRRAGAMVSGYEGIRRMSAVNAVLVDAADLFPQGTVVLNGLKPMTDEGLDKAVLNAGVLTEKVGGPLCGVFEQVLSEFEGELPEVSEARCVPGGVIGTVDGRKVLVGSAELLLSNGVMAPGKGELSRYTTGNRQLLFIAEDGVLCAMLILTYTADRKKKAELRELEVNGVAVIVRSTDANLTQPFLSKLFGLDPASIRVIPAGSNETCDAIATETAGRVDAYVATKGRAESMMHVISASIDEKKNISFIVAMQNAAVVIGFLLVAFLTLISGVAKISALALLIYEAFWMAAAILLPKLKNKLNK